MISRKLITLCASTLVLFACTDPEFTGVDPDNGDFGPANRRLDRMGHVEVGPLIIGTDTNLNNSELAVIDSFNREQPFGLSMSDSNRIDYIDALQAGLLRYDNYDSYHIGGLPGIGFLQELAEDRETETPDPTRLDWVDDLETLHPLMGVYLTDALFVDITKPCRGDGYFKPELAALAGVENQSCGGRLPAEDVIDKFATVLINGVNDRVIHDEDLEEMEGEDFDAYPDRGDSVTRPHVEIGRNFPYLAEPYSRFFGN